MHFARMLSDSRPASRVRGLVFSNLHGLLARGNRNSEEEPMASMQSIECASHTHVIHLTARVATFLRISRLSLTGKLP